MTYVALATVVLALVEGLSFARVLTSMIRQHARERDKLIDQVCHLSGRAWTPPPADQWDPPAEPGPVLFSSPEQMTADDFDYDPLV